MKGWLTSEHTAYVSLEIHGSDNEHDVVIDTGFNGSLYLPEETIVGLGLHFVSSVPIALADQTTMIVDAYEASVVWFGASMRVCSGAGRVTRL